MKIPNGDRADLGNKGHHYLLNSLHRQVSTRPKSLSRPSEAHSPTWMYCEQHFYTRLLILRMQSTRAITDTAVCTNFVFLSWRQKRQPRITQCCT